jgi:hypothetical protein
VCGATSDRFTFPLLCRTLVECGRHEGDVTKGHEGHEVQGVEGDEGQEGDEGDEGQGPGDEGQANAHQILVRDLDGAVLPVEAHWAEVGERPGRRDLGPHPSPWLEETEGDEDDEGDEGDEGQEVSPHCRVWSDIRSVHFSSAVSDLGRVRWSRRR